MTGNSSQWSWWRRRGTRGLVAALGAALALGVAAPGSQAQDPAFPGSVVLGRPTDRSVTANVVADVPLELYLEYGPEGAAFDRRTVAANQPAREPYEVVLDGLAADRDHQYRLRYRPTASVEFAVGPTHSFHTQRPPDSPFTFVIQADSHLDEQSDLEIYKQALRNQAADRADFIIDLGDTFFSEKVAKTEPEVIDRHLLQRPLLGMVADSAPLFLALGNHEGESGAYLNGSDQNMAVWATRARQKYYPNPYPDGFYTGNGTFGPFVGQREDYYAWEWGDVLFVVLDPFWNTMVKPQRAGTNWAWTLGETQYRWMVQTLESSRARFKLVFTHNLVGGVSFEGRGGVEGAPYYEWGGRNPDGSWGFDAQRPGWGRPIHQVFMDTGVNAWFHGHDHLFVKQELDGIIYQEVPQPSHPRGDTKRATDPEYNYLSGDVLGSSGHLRLHVQPDAITVEYVRAYRADDPKNAARNGAVDYRYEIRPRGAPPGPTPDLPTPQPTARPTRRPTARPSEPPPTPVATATSPVEPPRRLFLPCLLRPAGSPGQVTRLGAGKGTAR